MNILVIRFSSFGDVALLTPVLSSLLANNSDLKITLITNKAFSPIFNNIDRLQIIPADLKGKHKGITGLMRLAMETVNASKFDLGIDLHLSLRSRVIKFVFKLNGLKFKSFAKGRKEKKEFIGRTRNTKLPHTIERYIKPFEGLNLNTSIAQGPWIIANVRGEGNIKNIIDSSSSKTLNIGIAPFAKHQLKEWGISKTIELIELISKNLDSNIYLFGATGNEKSSILEIQKSFPAIVNVTDSLELEDELELIKKLTLMISMDSANMHLAALSSIPVISIWGPTHPDLGFSPYQEKETN
ncbi:MAG: glycosyltransferase family 9 protein, partial [Flavobacteriales bacterium]|nr:glycosyltransferase family 9 protein [Flavobacteriales bacterium]